MNVKLVYANKVESFDTRADGSANISHAALELIGVEGGGGTNLVLWSDLRYDDAYDERGKATQKRTERGTPMAILKLDGASPNTIPDFAEAYAQKAGLLRLDIDGETIWEAESPEDSDDC